MIPLVDLKAQYKVIGSELEAAACRVLASGEYILGAEVKALEEEIASLCGVKHAVGVANGTDALMLCLEAAGVGPGDEVITSPYTFFATAEVIARLGGKPVFVDIDWQTMNLEPALVEKAVTEKTKAIIPVHIFGQPAEMDTINKIAAERGLFVLEDACQAIGASYKGKKVGSLGDCACFSFYPTKNLGGAGDGGMVVTNNTQLAEKVRTLRAHGSKRKYYHNLIGVNSRLDNLQAALLRVKLPYLQGWNRARRKKAEIYNRLLSGTDILLPYEAPERESVYHLYVIRHDNRDIIIKELRLNEIAYGIYYPQPLHLAPALDYLGYSCGKFPNAEKASEQALALPMFPELTEEQQCVIASSIREVV